MKIISPSMMDMYKKNVHVLAEKQRQGLAQCLQQIEHWEKVKADYENLKSRLQTMADRLSYEVMVPFGTQAFMPGRIVSTNEILVLLGDNWFVERSTKQATEIAERRISCCNKMLEGLQAEKQQFENWMNFTAEMMPNEERVEIVEEYDPEKEEKWRVQHRENVKKHRLKEAQSKQGRQVSGSEEATEEQLSDSALMERLNALELEEQEENESELAAEENNQASGSEIEQPAECKKNVRWKDQEVHRPVTIPIKHSPSPSATLSFSVGPQEGEGDAVSLNSPSDIYNVYKMDNIKSILKVKGSTTRPHVEASAVWSKCVGVTGNYAQSSDPQTVEIPSRKSCSSAPAFTGEVTERMPKSSHRTAPTSLKRPVSQFKKQRSKK